jgi:broad specificity phosphatase PhoE
MVVRLYLIRHGETEDADTRRYKGHLDVPLSEKGIRQIERLSQYIVKDSSRWFNEVVQDGSMMVQNSSNHSILNNIEPLNNLEPPLLRGVYCSDLKRAIQSAEIISEALGLEPVVVPGLRERGFGEWEGMTFDEIVERWPDAFKSWAENPLRHSPPGGESTIGVRDRVMSALNKLLTKVQSSSKSFKIVQDSSMVVQSGSKVVQDGSGLNNIEQHLTTLNQIIVVAHGGVNRIILCELLGIPLENIFRIEQDYACLNIIELHDNYPIAKLVNYTL